MKMRYYNFEIAGIAVALLWLSMLIALFAAWATHVIACIKTSSWILLAFGVFIPPIGWLHGIANWFGLV